MAPTITTPIKKSRAQEPIRAGTEVAVPEGTPLAENCASFVASKPFSSRAVAACHRCDAFNCAIFEGARVVALRDIRPGEDLTVNFAQFSAELKQTEAVKCLCHGYDLVGFSALDEATQQQLFPLCTDAVRSAAIAKGFVPQSEPSIALEPVATTVTTSGGKWKTSCSRPNNGQMPFVAVAARAAPNHTVLATCTGISVPFPLQQTVALSDTEHLLFSGGGQYLNHSCDPNVRLFIEPEARAFDIIALRPIEAGEPLTFNYLTTEWSLAAPFACSCGESITGFAHLSVEGQSKLLPHISPAVFSVLERPQRLAQDQVSPARSDASTTAAVVDNSAEVAAKSLLRRGVASRPFARGDVVLDGIVTGSGGDALSIEIGRTDAWLHLERHGLYLSHSCDPTCVLISGCIIALRRLQRKDRLTLDFSVLRLRYTAAIPSKKDENESVVTPAAEEAPASFACDCGSAKCAGTVGGFMTLPKAQQAERIVFCDGAIRADATSAAHGYQVESVSECVAVRPNGDMGQATFAARDIQAEECVFHCQGLILPFPTMYTICMTPTKHLLFGGGAECLAHHCDPNVKIVVGDDCASFRCVALRPIKSGDLIAFNYLTSEWTMDVPFGCLCGSPKCFKTINGFANVADEGRRAELDALLTPAVRMLFAFSRASDAVALRDFARGDIVLDKVARPSDGNTLEYVTSPTGAGRLHVPHSNMFLEHSCDPNGLFLAGRIVATRPIAKGERLTIDFSILQLRLPKAFNCDCNAARCFKTIGGFMTLPTDVQAKCIRCCDGDLRNAAYDEGYAVVSENPDMVEIRPNGAMNQAAYAARDIQKGERLFPADGLVVPFKTMYTICMTPTRHLLFGGGAEYLAHHCDANVACCVRPTQDGFDFIARRDIEAGEMVAFNYLTTEWEMDGPFDCLCGSPKCYGYINGFRNVPDSRKEELAELLSPACIAQWKGTA